MTEPGPVVLVVEDEAQVRRFLRAALSSHGYRVVEATTVREGEQLATSHNPDVFLLDLGRGRPDVAKENITVVFTPANRLFCEVDIDAARKCKRYDQWGAHKEVGLHVLMHARFKVAIPAQHARADEVVLGDHFFDPGIERPRVAYAGRASIADEVEP